LDRATSHNHQQSLDCCLRWLLVLVLLCSAAGCSRYGFANRRSDGGSASDGAPASDGGTKDNSAGDATPLETAPSDTSSDLSPPSELSQPDGAAQAGWTVVYPGDNKQLLALTGRAGASVDEVVAVGAAGKVMRWTPTKGWLQESSCNKQTLNAVLPFQTSYVAGGDEATLCLRRGNKWAGLTPALSAPPGSSVDALALVSVTAFEAFGTAAPSAALARSYMTMPSASWSDVSNNLMAVGLRGAYYFAPNMVVVGDAGQAWVRTGSLWSKATGAQSNSDDLTGVWGKKKGTSAEFWVSMVRGNTGIFAKISEDLISGGWSLSIPCNKANSGGTAITMPPLRAVTGDVSTNTVWAVGDKGFVLQIKGSCEDLSPPQLKSSNIALRGVWAAAGRVYAVGDDGVIAVRY
jgi:hypothetical protein